MCRLAGFVVSRYRGRFIFRPGLMTKIDLISSARTATGQGLTPGRIVVETPWQAFALPDMNLPEGWYHMASTGGEVSLELYNPATFTRVELQASPASPAYIRLEAGDYQTSVTFASRPGTHGPETAQLSALSALDRYRLLFGRLLQALEGGVRPARLFQMIRTALSPGRTYGLRSRGQVAGELGVLSSADLSRDIGAQDFSARLEKLVDGPRFLIVGATATENQVYRRFSYDEAEPYDYSIHITGDTELTPDALLLFAEFAVRNPGKAIVTADLWLDGRPTTRVAWDPVLYNDGPPCPFAVKAGVEPAVTFGNREQCGVISVPVGRAGARAQAGREVPLSDGPPCSIIIPTRDRADLLEACLAGLFEKTAWPHEVIIIDNGSVDAATLRLFDAYAEKGIRVIRADLPFNFSHLCNLGARAATFEYLVFLNNDVVLHRPDWLAHLMAYAVRPEAGAVGARLLYGDGRLQHGGVMMGLTQMCGHLWRGLPPDAQEGRDQLSHSSLRSAVTAACLCVNKSKFFAVGEFDEFLFPVTLNDIDLCLKLGAAGWHNIYCSGAIAYHFEGESRGEDEAPEKKARRLSELSAFSGKWSGMTADPWLPLSISKVGEQGQYR